jgi:hypothetical protein
MLNLQAMSYGTPAQRELDSMLVNFKACNKTLVEISFFEEYPFVLQNV